MKTRGPLHDSKRLPDSPTHLSAGRHGAACRSDPVL
jgi:hypothetical protein